MAKTNNDKVHGWYVRLYGGAATGGDEPSEDAESPSRPRISEERWRAAAIADTCVVCGGHRYFWRAFRSCPECLAAYCWACTVKEARNSIFTECLHCGHRVDWNARLSYP
jgi:hypothetical protein